MKRTLFLVTFIFVVTASYAERIINIYDLEDTWYFNQGDLSLPYVKGNGLNPEAIHFSFDFNRFSGKKIDISHEYPFSVFIEGQLIFASEAKQGVFWDVDSLKDVFSNENVLVTIFSKNKSYDLLKTTIVKESLISNSPNEILQNTLKTNHNLSDFLFILIILLVIFTILLNSNRNAFNDFYSLDLILSGRVKDESIYRLKLFSQGNMILFLFHSGIISFFVLLITRFAFRSYAAQVEIFHSTILNWSTLTFLVLFAFLIKYVFIKYIGMLFDLGSAVNYYFYEYMRMSMMFFIVVLGITSITIISLPYLSENILSLLVKITIIFMFTRFIILFIRIGKHATFKKVHLFSYLCTTEMIPIIIGLKYLIF